MKKHYTFRPEGVCSSRIDLDVEDGRIFGLAFQDGCSGNLQAIGRLTEGMSIAEVTDKLLGISCGGGPTSCGDQLARALKKEFGGMKQ